MYNLKERSLAITHPQIAKDWHPTKNGGLKPEFFSYGSDVKVWWKCSKYGVEFQAKIYNRIKCGCYCCNEFERKSENYKIWFNECNVVKEYYITNNYLPITKRYSEIDGKMINVYSWIRNQRDRYRNGKLSDAQIEKLNEIEIILNEIKNKGTKGTLRRKENSFSKTKGLELLWSKSNEIFMNSKARETETQKWTKIKYVNKKGVEKKDVRKEEKTG